MDSLSADRAAAWALYASAANKRMQVVLAMLPAASIAYGISGQRDDREYLDALVAEYTDLTANLLHRNERLGASERLDELFAEIGAELRGEWRPPAAAGPPRKRQRPA